MNWLTYPALLLLRALGVVGMQCSLLGMTLAGIVGTLLLPTYVAALIWVLLAYLSIASLYLLCGAKYCSYNVTATHRSNRQAGKRRELTSGNCYNRLAVACSSACSVNSASNSCCNNAWTRSPTPLRNSKKAPSW